jgi:hypothetical protein
MLKCGRGKVNIKGFFPELNSFFPVSSQNKVPVTDVTSLVDTEHSFSRGTVAWGGGGGGGGRAQVRSFALKG